jgi:hypothetical protein
MYFVTATLQAQTAHFASVGWSHIGYDTTHYDVLNGLTVKAGHGCYLLTKQATPLIYIDLIAACFTAVSPFPRHQLFNLQ